MKLPTKTSSSLPRFAKAFAGGLGLASLGIAPTRATALEPAYGAGIYVGATFGDGERARINYGLEARATAMQNYGACEDDVTFWSGGGVARLDFTGTKGRFVLGRSGRLQLFLRKQRENWHSASGSMSQAWTSSAALVWGLAL